MHPAHFADGGIRFSRWVVEMPNGFTVHLRRIVADNYSMAYVGSWADNPVLVPHRLNATDVSFLLAFLADIRVGS